MLFSSVCFADNHSMDYAPMLTTDTTYCYVGTTDPGCYHHYTPEHIKAHERFIERDIAWYAPPPEESWLEDYFYADDVSRDKWIVHTILCILKPTLFILLGLFLLCCISIIFWTLMIVYNIIACILNIFLRLFNVELPMVEIPEIESTSNEKDSGPGFWTGLILGGLFF